MYLMIYLSVDVVTVIMSFITVYRCGSQPGTETNNTEEKYVSISHLILLQFILPLYVKEILE